MKRRRRERDWLNIRRVTKGQRSGWKGTVCSREGTGDKKVGNCAIRCLEKTSVWDSVLECKKQARVPAEELHSYSHSYSAERKMTFCTICTVYFTVDMCVCEDTGVCVTPTPAVLTPVCSDILRRIQALQSQSTYSALVSLPHRGWTSVCVCAWELQIQSPSLTLTEKQFCVLTEKLQKVFVTTFVMIRQN